MNKLLCVCLILAFGRASADCQLSATDVSNTKYLFTYVDKNKSNLLRRDKVATGQVLNMVCNAQNVVQTTCQANGAFSVPFPMTNCVTPVKPVVEPIADSKCSYTMYRVGYKLSSGKFFELYKTCYDPSTMTGHFVIHKMYPSSLTSRPNQEFTMDGIITAAMKASDKTENIFYRFQSLFGQNQPYVATNKQKIIHRGHLAPSADFGFDQYMRLSFKYINVVAQFASVNIGNWKKIEDWTRKLANDGGRSLMIRTGALGVLELPDTNGNPVAVYLLAPQGNPVPEWIYKLVKDAQGNLYAFVTYNNVYNPTVPTPNCNQVTCPSTLRFTPTKEAGFSFCCDPYDFVNRNLANYANVG